MYKRINIVKLGYGVLMGALLIPVYGNAQIVVDVAPPLSNTTTLAPFKNGFAAVSNGNERYYINTKGEKISVLGNAVLGDAYQVEEYEKEREKTGTRALPTLVIIFEKDGKHGVLSPAGELLVPAEYDYIDTEYQMFWALHRGGKKTFYLPDGRMLPFFDDIGYLDGEYFDVKQNSEWHLYSKSKSRIVTKQAYEGFDYCGGCSVRSPYVYAKKNGKWGIISWEEEVLVPFAYEHEHRAMRSDNWVQSFFQKDSEVIVHIPTQQVFDATLPHTVLISGMLVTQKNGLFGAYDREGKLAVPFEYDELDSPNDNSYLGYYGNYLIAGKDGKKGIIGADGTLLLPVEYAEVYVYDDYFVAKKGTQTYLFHKGSLKPLIAMEHAEISHVNEYFYSSGSGGLAVFRIKQKAYYGLYFAEHDRFYEPAFYDILSQRNEWMEGGEVIVGEKQGVKTLFNVGGERILPFDVQDYGVFDAQEKALLAFKVNGKWGLYDLEQGKEIVPASFDQYFKLLDSSANIVIQAFEDGFRGIGLYDLDGNKLHDTLLNRVELIGGQQYLVEKGNIGEVQYAVFDAERKTMEELAYPFVATVSGSTNLLMVSHDGQQGQLYHVKQKEVLPRRYETYLFSSLLDASEKPKNWLFYGFEDGYGQVQSADGIGFIDESGGVVMPLKYAKARMVGNDYVLVSEGEYTRGLLKSYFIDKKGKRIFPQEYFVDDMLYYNAYQFDIGDRAILVRMDTNGYPLFGLGDLTTGKMLIRAEYEEIKPILDQPYLMLVQRIPEKSQRRSGGSQKYGLASIQGEILFEPQFEGMYLPTVSMYGDRGKGDSLFPLLVYFEDKWRYLNEDGSYLPVEGDHINRY